MYDTRDLCSEHRRSQGGRAPPPIEMTPMIEMWQKSLLFLQFQFLVASSRTTVHVYTGAYLGGGHWAMAPLWVARIAKLPSKVSKIEAWPPFVSWASGFWLENWVSSGEKRDGPWVKTFFFFFFWRWPNFGRKKPLNFGFWPKNHSEFWRRPFFFFEIT